METTNNARLLFTARLGMIAVAVLAGLFLSSVRSPADHETTRDQAVSFQSDTMAIQVAHPSYHSFGAAAIAQDDGNGSQITKKTVHTTEARNANLKLSVEGSWIWDYQEPVRSTSAGPTQVVTTEHGIGGSSSSSAEPGIPGNLSPGNATPLEAPVFSQLSGTFPVSDFDLELTLANPNPSGSSAIYYKVDEGDWTLFAPDSSEPINVSPGSAVTAMAKSVVSSWSDSDEAIESYLAEAVKLAKPKVKNNNGHGNNIDGVDMSNPGNSKEGEDSNPAVDDEKWVLVEIENPNDSEYSDIEYTINGADWMSYVEPFLVRESTFASGAVVKAKVKNNGKHANAEVQDSDTVIEHLTWLDPVLDRPGIQMSARRFNYAENATVQVTFDNPNNPADTAVDYRINGGAWNRYDGQPVVLDVVDYPAAPAQVEARTVGTKPYLIDEALFEYQDSNVTEDAVETAADPSVDADVYASAWSE